MEIKIIHETMFYIATTSKGNLVTKIEAQTQSGNEELKLVVLSLIFSLDTVCFQIHMIPIGLIN